MNRYRLTILSLAFSLLSFSQEIVQLTFSKPFALLKFFETAKGGHGISGTFRKQIDSSKVLQDKAFRDLVKTYRSLELDYTWSKQFYPEKRKHTTSTWDLLCIASISSNTNDDFFNRIIGILPNDDYLKLKQVFTKGDPFYNAFMFTKNETAINTKLQELKTLSPKLNELFDKFKLFYGSCWEKTMPFHLTIYPIFGKRGATTATPHANSLEMGFLLEDKNNDDMASVGVHEMCHVLFEEQPLWIQQQLDSAFNKPSDKFAQLAYRYIDEALATSLGNGYAYKYLAGKLDTANWYNDTYINLYAKALYPLTTQYVDEHQQIDKAFVLKAIDIFKHTFPDALYDIDAAMMTSDSYFEDDVTEVIDEMRNKLYSTFRIAMSSTYIPFNDKDAQESLKTSEQAQLVVIHKNQVQNLALLKAHFKNLKDLPKQKNMLITFIDKNSRPIMIIVAENQTKAIEGLKLLKDQKKIDPKRLWLVF